MNNLPSSDLNSFKQQLLNSNVAFVNQEQPSNIIKIQKNIIIAMQADTTGCGTLRCVYPMTYLNSIFGKGGQFCLILTSVAILQPDILARTRTVWFQRTMSPQHIPLVRQYKELQKRLGFKMVHEIDDFIWNNENNPEERIPAYNFGGKTIDEATRKASIEIMNMMNECYVTTQFLKDYVTSHGVNVPVKLLPNHVCQHLWGPDRRKPIKNKIQKPKIILTSSPTHYLNQEKLAGDFDGNWTKWLIKNVKCDKITLFCMGGLPFFFEELKQYSNFKFIEWTTTFMYHIPIKEFRPDFTIAPLVPNFFNYAKSDLKMIEAYAYGSVFIGTTFKNNQPSPYDNSFLKTYNDITVEEIDEMFWKLTEPEVYNDLIKQQYNCLDTTGRWLESKECVDLWMKAILG